ncbi:hypothetical protein LTR64_007835 [Lithohypha guttulata]|uniref:uncharacterized protein n=1 Tax=Lithohypha guttulata TaxID=1690604 RepID=UPI002DDFC02E|nr:hypothetical protein LTR51_007347 [Lithohypha guttulata]
MGDRYSGRSPRRGPPGRAPPNRDRDRDRDRDDHPNVEYYGAGESYRPGGQSGDGPYRPPRERENDRWNPPPPPPPREERRRDHDIDSYIPPTSIRARQQANKSRSPPPYRRRSRTPPSTRGRTELFPDRAARSPSRRQSPPRDRARTPPRRRSRSPFGARARSPDNRRVRDYSPDGRRSLRRESPPRNRYDDGPRSPPRRPVSPGRNTYRPRSRTPPRRDDVRPSYADERWRRRSPSPRGSGTTSRRSSPPFHPDRASLTGSRTHSPARDRPRYDDRDRRDDGYGSRPRSPPPLRDDYLDQGRNRSREDPARPHDEYATPAPPTGPRGAGYGRPPPTGPARSHAAQATSPPPTASGASSRSTTFAPPSGPRGAPNRDFVSPPAALRGRTSLTYRAPGYRPPLPNQTASFEAPLAPPPSGPRAASYSSRGDFTSSSRGSHSNGISRPSPTTPNQEFPFRPNNNSSSSTYPRSQRFDTARPSGPPTGPSSVSTTFNHATSSPATPATPAAPASFVKSQLSTLERIVPGGKHIPGSAQSSTGLSADQERKLKILEDDAERIRTEIFDKQKSKREVLRDWEVREKESEIAALKSELAEESLRTLGEEDSAMVGAAF